jgi:hypothetical protein
MDLTLASPLLEEEKILTLNFYAALAAATINLY